MRPKERDRYLHQCLLICLAIITAQIIVGDRGDATAVAMVGFAFWFQTLRQQVGKTEHPSHEHDNEEEHA